MRNFMDTLRSSGVETGGPPPFRSQTDRQAFASQLDCFLAHMLRQPGTATEKRALLSWSGGRTAPGHCMYCASVADCEVVGCSARVNQAFDRVAMGATRSGCCAGRQQQRACHFRPSRFPYPCDNATYAADGRFRCQRPPPALSRWRSATCFCRRPPLPREQTLPAAASKPVFPLWEIPTAGWQPVCSLPASKPICAVDPPPARPALPAGAGITRCWRSCRPTSILRRKSNSTAVVVIGRFSTGVGRQHQQWQSATASCLPDVFAG